MPKGFYKEVCAEIKAHGYAYLTNAKGSHEKWKHAETNIVVLVPKNLKRPPHSQYNYEKRWIEQKILIFGLEQFRFLRNRKSLNA